MFRERINGKKNDKTAGSDKGEIILYRSPDGKAALDVRLEQETAWLRGFTLNEKRLREQEQKLVDLRRTVGLLEQTLAQQAIGLDEAKGLLQVITDYA